MRIVTLKIFMTFRTDDDGSIVFENVLEGDANHTISMALMSTFALLYTIV